ncbi:MAG: carbohydrate-binding domain-containing protein [Prevotella sp.]|nr:carbohydrate-binding domain-containing protein [Prevotella sp.]
MKRKLLTLLALTLCASAFCAIDPNTVEVKFNGNTATVTMADNIKSFVTVASGTSSHVKLVQAESFLGIDATTDNEDGEIIYVLSGTSTDGEFYLEGAFKCTVELNGIELTNPSGPAINLQNGKRCSVSAKKGTTNTISDGANDDFNGCYHCKGHTKFKGKGTLNVTGNSAHAVYSKEYVEIKNLTLNITSAVKDGIHCKEYFLMESGTVNINTASDDGIQVELANDPVTGVIAGHEDENTGNFYMTGGTLTISSYKGKTVKADGDIVITGGKRNYDENDMQSYAGIADQWADATAASFYDLNGRRISQPQLRGIYIERRGNKTIKRIVR